MQKLFKQAEKLESDDTEELQQLVMEACQELTLHADIEEELFYPALAAAADDDDPVAAVAEMTGIDSATYLLEAPGVSSFALEDGVIYHTYSAYARGLDQLWAMYQWLDRAPKGRNETGLWFRRRDEYDAK